MRTPGGPFDSGLRRADLDPARPTPFESPWGELAFYVVGERLVAADAWCPHMHGPLLQGSVRDARVTCPWHSWVFSLESGACVWAPDEDAARGKRIGLHAVTEGAAGTLLVHPPDQRPDQRAMQ